MGIISSYTVGMSLRHKRRHDETNTLTSVTAPRRLLCYINIFLSIACLSYKGKIGF